MVFYMDLRAAESASGPRTGFACGPNNPTLIFFFGTSRSATTHLYILDGRLSRIRRSGKEAGKQGLIFQCLSGVFVRIMTKPSQSRFMTAKNANSHECQELLTISTRLFVSMLFCSPAIMVDVKL